MKAWEVIGYAADADIWCPACAREAYGPLTDQSEDHEGNLIHPIFACDEWDYPLVCHCCHEALTE
ncbi:MAG: hypothetical protein LLG45_12525 [Actinomycetia bacterium]|nr:hypothetical protein [Actinomycetes bacterium]